MSSRQPLVSIGMAVYNGEDFLCKAVDSLLAQDIQDFELIISDNASTDRTPELCRQYAARDAKVRYYRNEENIGALRNFSRVFELSSGKYFMWASHDDMWSRNYISELLNCSRASDGVALAAARTVYITSNGESHNGREDRSPGPGLNTITLAESLLEQHATSWIYGLYDKESLAGLLPLFQRLPGWGGDVIFLLHLCLNYKVTGSDEAVIYKRVTGHSGVRPKTPRQRAKWQAQFSWHFFREILNSPLSLREKQRLIAMSSHYVRRLAFSGGGVGVVTLWLRAFTQWCKGVNRA